MDTARTTDEAVSGGRPAESSAIRARRGRPRSDRARTAVLVAAAELLEEGGLPAVTVEAISSRSKVGKPTIYRYWSNRTAVAIDAFSARMADRVPTADLGNARRDLTEQVRRVAAFYASPAGAVLVQLVAACATDPDASRQLRDRFLSGRRADMTRIWERAIERGEARPSVSADVAIDVLFSPIVYRLMIGHAPIDPDAAAKLAEAALGGLLNPRPEPATGCGGRQAATRTQGPKKP